MAGTRSRDAGFSLIETLVTVMIVGIAFVVFVGGMGTAFVASDHHRKRSVSQADIRNFAEAVKSAPFSTDCNVTNLKTAYAAAYSPPPPTRRTSAGAAVNATSHVADSITPESANSRLLAFYAFAGSPTTWTLPMPTVMTQRWKFGPAQVSIGLTDQVLSSVAPTGPRFASSSVAANSIAQLVAIPGATGSTDVRGASLLHSGDANVTSLDLVAPTQTLADDTMLAQVAVRGTTNVSPPPGWTLVSAKTHGIGLRSLIYERVAVQNGSPNPVRFLWTFSAPTQAAGGVISFAGVRKPFEATVTDVKFWNGTTFVASPCPAAEDNYIQQVSLRVRSTDQRGVATIDVIKRCHAKPYPSDPCEDS